MMLMAANVHWSTLMHPMAETLPARMKCLHEVFNRPPAGFCFSCVYMCNFSSFEKSTTVITMLLEWLTSRVVGQITRLSGIIIVSLVYFYAHM